MHLPDSRIRQQLLSVFPENFLAYLQLEIDLDGLKVLHPALGSDEGVV